MRIKKMPGVTYWWIQLLFIAFGDMLFKTYDCFYERVEAAAYKHFSLQLKRAVSAIEEVEKNKLTARKGFDSESAIRRIRSDLKILIEVINAQVNLTYNRYHKMFIFRKHDMPKTDLNEKMLEKYKNIFEEDNH